MRLMIKKLSACILASAMFLTTDFGAWSSSLQARADTLSFMDTASPFTVSVDDTTVMVAGKTGSQGGASGSQLKLYELAPYQSEQDIGSLTPVSMQDAPAAGGAFRFTVSRYDNQRDRYYSKFLVAEQAPGSSGAPQLIGAPQYATDIRFSAARTYLYPAASTKKGLLVEMTDDAEELGIGHAVVNVEMSTMMFKQKLNPSNTIDYTMDGSTFYFSKSYFENLDRKIKTLSDNGVIVNLVLILYPNFPANSMTDVLHHPNAVLGTGGGGVLAFNTVQKEGLQAFKAAMEFLTERYTREDQRYGRAVGYIVGNEVDAQWEWQNMGYATLEQFVEQYESALRIAYMAARKHYANARVYTSLTNHWAKAYDSNPLKGYAGRELIDKLNQQSKMNGDFPWHIAYHPYPEDFFNTDTWNDAQATDSVDANVVTFKNIHILNNYMGQDSLKCGTQKRRIILSEQGFHTADNSQASAESQAAAFAYAYYKTEFLDGIDSLILFSHVDIPSYGLNMGLWTQDPGTSTPFAPKDKKYIYDVFKYIDTDQSLAVTDFAKSIIGISDWSEAVPGFDAHALAVRETPAALPLVLESATPVASGDSFDADTNGWSAADNASSAVRTTADRYAGAGALEVAFSSAALKWRGAEKWFAAPRDAAAAPYLRLAVKLTGTASGSPYSIRVKVYSGDKTAEGTASVNPAGGWISLSLNLSGWEGIRAIDRIKVWAGSTGTGTWTGKLLLDEVSFAAGGSASPNDKGTNKLASYERILFNFEGSTQGWKAGDNVDSVTSVRSMANFPTTPDLGGYMLEAQFPTGAADVWRTVSYVPTDRLNLTDADAFVYAVNCYGGSGGTGYETRLRLYSGNQMLEKTFSMSADVWNSFGMDLTGWDFRSSITKIEISFRAVGTSAEWYGSRFQLDTIRFIAHDNLEDETDLKERSLEPFWNGTTMYNEPVLMVSHAGERPEANLLFAPGSILSVRSARLDREYVQNIDWVLENGKLKLTPQSRIPYLTDDDLYYPSYIPGFTMPKNGGGAVIYREGSYFHDRQIVVTYTHAANAWTGPKPALADGKLTGTLSKLRKGEPLRLALYGDSISVGANASGYTDVSPHLPIWGQMVADGLEQHYGSHVTFINPSVGGQTSTWGKDQAASLVANKSPDLVIIAFGMNDGSGTGAGDGTAPAVFKRNIASIINSVRAVNPAAEFILVGTTLPNAETFFYDKQPYYYAELSSLAASMNGVVAADMTGVHTELLRHKKFLDMTGNNINHPNDFLSRWYAQFMFGLLKDPSATPTRPDERLLYSFEDSTQGWVAGQNVTSVSKVSSFSNAPFGPAQGKYALEAQFPTQEADAWRTIKVTPPQALDLSKAGRFFYRINSYGGSGGTGYETRLRLYSGSNVLEQTTAMKADTWNVIQKDISGWAYKHKVTSIEIAFRATGSSALWYGSRFQIDDVGYRIDDVNLFDFEGSLNGWEAGSNVRSVSSVDRFANAPYRPKKNAYALEASFPDKAANEWRTISITPTAALNLTNASHFYYYIDSYGGSGGTGYETRLRLYSGKNVLEQTTAMKADAWNRIETNISGWAYRANITKIEISFRATGTSALWYGSRFQIDDVGYRKK